MILKNIFGKTVEAAKKTAHQMYGDDILILEAIEPILDGQKAKVTIFSDTKIEEKHAPKLPKKTLDDRLNENLSPTNQPDSSNLISLRKYATEQILTKKKNETKKELAVVGDQFLPHEEPLQEKNSHQFYGRSSLQTKSTTNIEEEINLAVKTPSTITSKNSGKFITRFKESEKKEKFKTLRNINKSSIENQKAIKALHKRFDKLEVLLDSSFISANLDYACHPVFQQLVQTGINTSTVSGWFSNIIKNGVDPFVHNKLFMAKLASILRESLGKVPTKDPSKFMLFAGAAGSGKTTLIMKLCLHPDFMLNKNIAVMTIHPQQNYENNYYSILKGFCRNENIPHYTVKKGLDVGDYIEEWKEFDHVLIDTPSLSIEREDSFREYWKIRQLLTPLTPLEVHFVVDASRSKFYFANTTAKNHPMQPDYISITHLDEVSQWGHIIPFMKEMDCTTKYISNGNVQPTSLSEFNPQWFAQKVLEG
jgi:flagellar biosynthesis GTPase FlhF